MKKTARRRWWAGLGAAILVVGSVLAPVATTDSGAVSANTPTDLPGPSSNGGGSWLGVSCPAVDDCVAVGVDTATSPSEPMYDVETNGTWATALDVASPNTSGTLYAVNCPSTGNCLAVGQDTGNGKPFFVTMSSGTWGTSHDLSTPSSNHTGALTAVSCAGSTCVAVGQDNGGSSVEAFYDTLASGTWTPNDFTTPGVAFLNGVSCTDANDCTAVGEAVTSGGTLEPVVATETLGAWPTSPTFVPTTNTTGTFNAVSCPTASTCTVVGTDVSNNDALYDTESSGTWPTPTDLSEPIPDPYLSSVSCQSSTTCTAVGESISNHEPVLETESSGTWEEMSELSSPDVTGSFGAVSCVNAQYCTALGGDIGDGKGFYDLIVPLTINDAAVDAIAPLSGATAPTAILADSEFTGVIAWSGNPTTFAPSTSYTATITLTPTSGFTLTGVAANFFTVSGAMTVANAANSGVVTAVFPSTGSVIPNTPSDLASPSSHGWGFFQDTSCPAAGYCVAVGADTGGSVTEPMYDIETNGSWGTVMDLPSPNNHGELYSVSCTAVGHCVAVGLDSGNSEPYYEILSSSTWGTPQDIPTPSSGHTGFLLSISCASSTCVAVGYDSGGSTDKALYDTFSSGAWTSNDLTTPGIAYLNGVSCADATDCTAVGEAQSSGGTFEPIVATESSGAWPSGPTFVPTTNTAGTFTAVSCPTASTCTAVGTDLSTNAVFYDTESGATWSTPTDLPDSVSEPSFIGISCQSATSCTAVGDSVSDNVPLLEVESGGAWEEMSEIASPDVTGSFRAVSCVSAQDCTAVGIDDIALGEAKGLFDHVIPRAITDATVDLVPPLLGATAPSAIVADSQFTGTIAWSGSPTTFAASTSYTATITLLPTSGFTLTGVAANFFTIAGATSVANAASSGVVTAVFPATNAPPPPATAATTTTTTTSTTTTTTTTTTLATTTTTTTPTARAPRLTRVTFTTDSVTLSSVAKRVLNRLSATLVRARVRHLVVTGYAAPGDSGPLNRALSSKRALNVATYLHQCLIQRHDRGVVIVSRAGGASTKTGTKDPFVTITA